MKNKNALKLMFGIFFSIGLAFSAVVIVMLVRGAMTPLPFVFGVQALVWLSIGGIGLAVVLMKEKRRAYLLENGDRISAKITEVYIDQTMSYNGRRPYRIACQYVDDGTKTIYTFKSEPLFFDPRPLLSGDRIDVCTDYNRFDRYAVDVKSAIGDYEIKNY